MKKASKVKKSSLIRAGMELMRQNGKPLTEMPGQGPATICKMDNGETVRVRTCNRHILLAVAKGPEIEAKMNTEGTDWILIVMPEVEQTNGKVVAYLIPAQEAVDEARNAHAEWRAGDPKTRGDNTTRNLWFGGDSGPADGYAQKWAHYRLEGNASTVDAETESAEMSGAEPSGHGGLKAVIETAQSNIASAAGVSPQAVKISIDFAA